MNTHTPAKAIPTMSSLEMVDFINDDRKERAQAVGAVFPSPGFAKLEHKHFLDKVPDVLGETSAEFSADLPDAYGRARRGYRFPKREAILMAMSYSYGLQAKVFDRMTALEQQLPQAVSALPDFSNPAAAARAWAEQFEQREQLKLENQAQTAALALAAPKVEYVDRYVAADTGSMGVREVAKVLGAKMNAFTGFLLAHFMHRTTPHGPLTPNAEHIHNGRFQAKTGIAEHTNSAHAYVHYKFTAKGVAWISGEWGKHQAKLAKKQETRHG